MFVTLEVGLELEKYTILRELGRGGMGVVYLAEDKQLNRKVALKVLYEHLYRESNFVERFREEARSVSTLHHPNIVCVHGLEQSGELLAIDMEYVEGFSLDQRLEKSRVTPHVAVAIARDVLGGLTTCHHIGIVHRDIKPSNILIHEHGAAKLTDFGLATAYACHLEDTVRGGTSSGFYMGTPRYMPACAWEGGEPNPAWDTYALGVVIYEMLTGTVAYPGDNPLAIMKRHLTEPLPPVASLRDGLSPALGTLVDRLVLEPDESKIESGEALRLLQETPEYEALKDTDGAVTVSVPKRRRRVARSPMWDRARRALGPLAALLLFVGLVGVAIWLYDPVADPHGASFAGPVFMDLREMGGDAVERWMMEPEEDGTGYVLTGYSSSGLSRMHAGAIGNGDWKVTGGWAEYVAPSAGSMQYGPVAGTLHWAPGEQMLLQLERVREKDNERTERTFVGRPMAGTADRTAFLRRLEARARLQSLLYTELLYRPLDWAREIEALFPARASTRFDVPWTAESIVVDGMLEEAAWTSAFFLDGRRVIGDMSPNIRSARSMLKARWNSDFVYFGARVTSKTEELQWEVAIQPDFEISFENSERLLARIGASGSVRYRNFLGNDERPARFSWVVATRFQNGEQVLEVAIPGNLLSQEEGRPYAERWRVNIQCFREGLDSGREVLAQWGDDNTLLLQHGALLLFQKNVVGPGSRP